jgi:hypothetical protein
MWAGARKGVIAWLVVLSAAVAQAAVPADLDPVEADTAPAVAIDTGADTPVRPEPPAAAEPADATASARRRRLRRSPSNCRGHNCRWSERSPAKWKASVFFSNKSAIKSCA